MSLSVIDPIDPAFARTKRVLFQPFDLEKWLGLGFCAFLMTLAEGCGTGFSGGTPQSGGGGGQPDFEPALTWVRDNLSWILIAVLAAATLIFFLVLLLMWLGSRGSFMFLDGVIQNRGAVVDPWNEYRREANSLFRFRVCLGIVGILGVGLIGAFSVLIGWQDIQAREITAATLGAAIAGGLLLVGFAIVMKVIAVFLQDFIVPIMYLRRITVLAAWREFRASMLAGNGTTFLLYILMKIVISLVVGFLAMAATCLTCCLAAIPYVGAVILLPLAVFVRSYSLYFIEQFGSTWQIFPPDKPLSATVIDL